jgi:hypothetical protein
MGLKLGLFYPYMYGLDWPSAFYVVDLLLVIDIYYKEGIGLGFILPSCL